MAGQYGGALPSTQADWSGVADAIGRALGLSAAPTRAPQPLPAAQPAVPFLPAAFQRTAAPTALPAPPAIPMPPHGPRRGPCAQSSPTIAIREVATRRWLRLSASRRVGVWRGGVRLSMSVCRRFRLAVP